MARPKKIGVDYFPHSTQHGKTLFILKGKWGNDGYAFWFQLLEILGKTEGHVYKTEQSEDLIFLAASTGVTEEVAKDMLGTLADLGAIDSELWNTHGAIYSQNFVDGVADAYKRRKNELPSLEGVNVQLAGVSVRDDEVTEDEPKQKGHKGKERKGKEKEIYGEFENVKLSEDEYNKLGSDMGPKTRADYIERLDLYDKSGKYKNHNLTLRAWWKKDGKPTDPAPTAPVEDADFKAWQESRRAK